MRQFMLAAVFLALAVPEVSAQIRASELASVSQTVDGTTTTVNYSRPRARGRRGLFGSRIHWGETWTPGANQATTLGVSKDVTIEGTNVPKGKYSVWIVVQRASWEMVLDPDTTLFHTQRPRQRSGQIRFAIRREMRPFMEALTWWFPEVGASGATLALQWDTVYVPLRLRVSPSYSTTVTPEIAKRIAGTYQVKMEPEPQSNDSSNPTPDRIARNVKLTIRAEGNELRGVMDPPLFETEEGYKNWILIPTKGGWLYFGRIHEGELVEVVDFFQVQFDTAGERAAGFEIRAFNDALIGKGTRLR